jgi:hypothetical protein
VIASIVIVVVILWLLGETVSFVAYLASEGMFWRPIALLAGVGWGLWHFLALR